MQACIEKSKSVKLFLFKFWDVDFLCGTMKGQCKKNPARINNHHKKKNLVKSLMLATTDMIAETSAEHFFLQKGANAARQGIGSGLVRYLQTGLGGWALFK